MTYQSTILLDTPLRLYPLAETTTTATDRGLQAQNGTYVSLAAQGTKYLTPGDTTTTSATFNGTSSQVTLPTTGLALGTSAWSLEAWCIPTAVPGAGDYGAVISIGSASSRISLGYDANQHAYFTNGTGSQFGTTAQPINRILHLVATSDGATVLVYLNGVSVAPATALATNLTGLTFAQIGTANGAHWFTGLISQVAVYGYQLTATQVSAHFQAGCGDYYGAQLWATPSLQPNRWYRCSDTSGSSTAVDQGLDRTNGTWNGTSFPHGDPGALWADPDTATHLYGASSAAPPWSSFSAPVVVTGNSSFYVHGWFCVDSNGPSPVYFFHGDDVSSVRLQSNSNMSLWLGALNTPYGTIPGGWDSSISSQILPTETWVHLAVVYNGSTNTATGYVNGTQWLTNTANAALALLSSGILGVGTFSSHPPTGPFANQGFFSGGVDEICAGAGTLTQAQIAAIASAGIAGRPPTGSDAYGADTFAWNELALATTTPNLPGTTDTFSPLLLAYGPWRWYTGSAFFLDGGSSTEAAGTTTLTGAGAVSVNYQSAQVGSPVLNRIGASFLFDYVVGTGGTLTSGTSTALPQGAAPWSLLIWAYPPFELGGSAPNAAWPLISFGTTPAGPNAPQIGINPNFGLFYCNDGSFAGIFTRALSHVWTMLVATYDGSTLSLYSQGQLVGTQSRTFAVPSNTAVGMGSLSIAWPNFEHLLTEHAGIFKTCLTATQIQALYATAQSGLPPTAGSNGLALTYQISHYGSLGLPITYQITGSATRALALTYTIGAGTRVPSVNGLSGFPKPETIQFATPAPRYNLAGQPIRQGYQAMTWSWETMTDAEMSQILALYNPANPQVTVVYPDENLVWQQAQGFLLPPQFGTRATIAHTSVSLTFTHLIPQ